MTLARPEFPIVWDNSMRSAFVECPRKFFWEYLHHFKPKGESIHLHAGKAWAHGLEVARRSFYEKGFGPVASINEGLVALINEYGDFIAPERGSGAAKSLDRLVEAFA